MNALFSELHEGGAIGAAFSQYRLIEHCLRFERALAQVQAQQGIIPGAAALEIARVAHLPNIDLQLLKQKTSLVGLPIVGLVAQVVALCENDLGQYVHYGATTQDTMDCALALQMQEALDLVDAALRRLTVSLDGLAADYAAALQPGRTNQQHALPVTFGFKAAVWNAAVKRHLERLAQIRARTAVGQLGGAVGTLASMGDAGHETRRLLLRELGLAEPAIAWHAMRDGPTEAALLLAQIAATWAKIGRDLLVMSSTEVGEVRFAAGRGASSTMPQKNNPIAASSVVALAHMLCRTAPLLLDGSQVEHERSLDAWYIELHAMPMCFSLAGALLGQAEVMLAELSVDTARMTRNVALTGGAIVTETVQMELARYIGLNRAHDLVARACQQAQQAGSTITDALAQLYPEMEADRLQALLEPSAHTVYCMREVQAAGSGSAASKFPPT
jgi:3-carboxy-cis,cis-muconate cycloisomerase